MSIKRVAEERAASLPESFHVERKELFTREMAVRAFEQVPDVSRVKKSYFFAALTGLEVHLPHQIREVLISRGLCPVTECGYGDWIQKIVQQASFPLQHDVLEKMFKSIVAEIQTHINQAKQSLHPTFTEEDEKQELTVSKKLRNDIGLSSVKCLASALSEEDRSAGIQAAASQNAIEVIKAFLESGPCPAEIKKQLFVWSIQQGCLEIFSMFSPVLCATRESRTEAMLIACDSYQKDMLKNILLLGPVSERERQKVIDKFSKDQDMIKILSVSRSRLL